MGFPLWLQLSSSERCRSPRQPGSEAERPRPTSAPQGSASENSSVSHSQPMGKRNPVNPASVRSFLANRILARLAGSAHSSQLRALWDWRWRPLQES